MRRAAGQGVLAAVAVLPSLIAMAVLLLIVGGMPGRPSPMPAIVLGSAIMLTLVVDRRLSATDEAPAGWLGLRIPLSLGLGTLTIAAGLLLDR